MTILEKVNLEIANIKAKTIQGDVSRCAKITGLSVPVVCNYSLGKGANADTAIKILNGLKQIVDQREKQLL